MPERSLARAALDAKAIDIDKDGDIDLVTPGRSALYLLENQLK